MPRQKLAVLVLKAGSSVCALACVLAVGNVSAAAPESGPLRRLPYPFSHMISFASDVDAQMAWHGEAIHSLINERIGLPIASSIWVHGHGRRDGIPSGDSYLFKGLASPNRAASGVGGYPVFALLLRGWHKGYYDHFHGWQDDSTFQIRNVLTPPVALRAQVTSVDLPPPNALMKDPAYRRPYQHLRLYFDREPPVDLHLMVSDANGNVATVPRERINFALQVDRPRGKHIVEALFDVSPDLGLALGIEQLDVSILRNVKLVARSCARGCDTRLYRIDRDTFSRQTVLRQAPFLEAWNIRPALTIDHGGYSMAQDFAVPGFGYSYQRVGSVFGDGQIAVDMEFLADDKTSYAYSIDVLRRIGVTNVTPYGAKARAGFTDAQYPYTLASPPPQSTFTGLYNFPRSTLHFDDTDQPDAASFRRMLIAGEPLLAQIDTAPFYCPKLCMWPQGAHLGLLAAVSLLRAKSGAHVEHMWYTHFATGDPDWKRTPDKPLKESAVAWLERLADHYYDFRGKIDETQRVWVPPPGVFARYRVTHAGLRGHVSVNAATSEVTITPWKDSVTQTTLPEPGAGTRDLHGITIYVPDSQRARLFVGAREVVSFTRNRADVSGRQSITVVGDNAPTPILGEAPLRATGTVELSGVSVTDGDASRTDAARGSFYTSIAATRGGDGLVVYEPYELHLTNITHVQFAVRKFPNAGVLAFELVRSDGSIIGVQEHSGPAGAVPKGVDAGWWIAPIPADARWRYITLALDQLKWRTAPTERGTRGRDVAASPALPLGKITQVRIRLSDQRNGGRIDLDDVIALRPSSNGVAPDNSKLVAGRIAYPGGHPVPGAVVTGRAIGTNTTFSTVSDSDGLYFLYGIPSDALLGIEVDVAGVACVPRRGRIIEIRRDDAEVDIDTGDCRWPDRTKQVRSR